MAAPFDRQIFTHIISQTSRGCKRERQKYRKVFILSNMHFVGEYVFQLSILRENKRIDVQKKVEIEIISKKSCKFSKSTCISAQNGV